MKRSKKLVLGVVLAVVVMVSCLFLGFHLGRRQPASSASPGETATPVGAELPGGSTLPPPTATQRVPSEDDGESSSAMKDPVCKSYVDPDVTRFKAVFRDHEFYFCCEECRNLFNADPLKYLMKVKVKVNYSPGVEPIPTEALPAEIPTGDLPQSAPEGELTPGAPLPSSEESPPGAQAPAPTPEETLGPGEEEPPSTQAPPPEKTPEKPKSKK